MLLRISKFLGYLIYVHNRSEDTFAKNTSGTSIYYNQNRKQGCTKLVTVLKEHYEPKTRNIAWRFYFHHCDQAAHETVAECTALYNTE